MYDNPFIRPLSGYQRDLDILSNYNGIAATYLSIQTKQPYRDALDWVEKNTNPVDPILNVLARRTGADRAKEQQSFTKLLQEAYHGGKLLGPNLVMYENPEKKRSFTSEFIEVGMANRSKIKTRYKKAYMEGDLDLATFCDNQQVTVKTLNNTLSGAHASPHNPIFNPSAHTTLTSVCRCATTYSNAVVERLLAGNRHYYSPEVALGDMAAMIRNADMPLVESVITSLNIVPPSTDELLIQILVSCHQYWRSEEGEELLHDFIIALSNMERAIVAYTMDLYTFKLYNPDIVRSLFTRLVTIPEEGIEDAAEYHKAANSDMISMVGLVCSSILKGRRVQKMQEESIDEYQRYGAAIKNIMETFDHYGDFIKAFISTDNMPTNIHSVPVALRKVAVVSDTDSTIFTTSKWVDWYLGEGEHTRSEVMAIAGAVAYIDTQALAHTLAQLSRHLGVEDSKLFRLSMKSEFYMECIGVANKTKHYFSYVRACEGDVYPKAKLDLKGVNLKNSRLPKRVTQLLREYIQWIMDNALKSQRPNMSAVLETPAKLAHEMVGSLKAGGIEFLMNAQIKQAGAYKSPRAPAIQQYTLWESVFAPVYGHADIPPYSGVKVPVKLESRNDLEAWAIKLPESMQRDLRTWLLREVDYVTATERSGYDGVKGIQPIKQKTTALVAQRDTPACGPMGRIYQYKGHPDSVDLNTVDFKNNPAWEDIGGVKEGFTQFIIPSARLVDGKIPKHILDAINLEKIEDELMTGFYIVLETTGLYFKNNSRSRLLSREIDINLYK